MQLMMLAPIAFVLAACGTEASPVEKCDDLIDVLCDRGVQCLGGTHRECVQAVRSELPCGSAESVSSSYDRCLDQLESNSCGALFTTDPETGGVEIRLPADCMQVILTRTVSSPELDGEPVMSIGMTMVD